MKVSLANGSAKLMESTEGGGRNAVLRSARLHRATFRDGPIGRTAPMGKAGDSDWATCVASDPCRFCFVQLGPVRFRFVSSASFQNDPVRSGPVRSRSVGSHPLPENWSNFGRLIMCAWIRSSTLRSGHIPPDLICSGLAKSDPVLSDLVRPASVQSAPIRTRPV